MEKIKRVIKNTAKNNAVSAKEVKKEICYAISTAIENSKGNAQAEPFWNELTKNQRQPTPEELIAAIIERLATDNKLDL